MNDYITVEIADKRKLTEDVTELTLVASDGGLLPSWQPGAHIEFYVVQSSCWGLLWSRNRRSSKTSLSVLA